MFVIVRPYTANFKGLMWNIALDGQGNPKLPGTNSCGGPGCRALVTVNSDGSHSFNEECEYIVYL